MSQRKLHYKWIGLDGIVNLRGDKDKKNIVNNCVDFTILQKFAKAVSRRSKEESSLDQELAEFNLVINIFSNFFTILFACLPGD